MRKLVNFQQGRAQKVFFLSLISMQKYLNKSICNKFEKCVVELICKTGMVREMNILI